MAIEQLQHIIHREPWATWLRPGGCLESAHCELTDLLSSVIAADRARRAALPAEGELADLAGSVEARATWLDEGTPEERLLRRVAYVLRQRQAPPHEGEVDALIDVLSRIAGMLDFMPDGPPDGLVIHRAIELLRQLTRTGAMIQQQAAVLQQQAAELAMLRQVAVPVPVSERPWTNEAGWLDPDGECWWCPPDGPAYWSMANPAMVYGGWLLPAHAIPVPPENRHHA